MELLKKLAWTIFLLLLFGGLIFGGIYLRNILTAKNYSDYWQQQAIDSGDYIYVVLGDSTALGIGSTDPKKSYPGIIKERLQESNGKLVKIINLATLDADIQKVQVEQLPKLQIYKPDLVTISVGQKDIDQGRDTATISKDLRSILEKLPNHVSYIAELPATYDDRKNLKIKDVNLQLRLDGQEIGVNVVPLYDATKIGITATTYYDWDFYHPSDKGHAIWADAFWNQIE